MQFHEVVMHSVVRKLLIYQQTNRQTDRQTSKVKNNISFGGGNNKPQKYFNKYKKLEWSLASHAGNCKTLSKHSEYANTNKFSIRKTILMINEDFFFFFFFLLLLQYILSVILFQQGV